MCCLKGKNRSQVCFHVTPPEQGDYLLKIYAKPEEDILNESDTLDHIATFHIQAKQIKIKPMPLPKCDLPWGLTPAWFDTGASVLGMNKGPIIEMIGEKRRELIILTPKDPLLSLCHIYDSSGNELVQDQDSEIKYTVLLKRGNGLPSVQDEDEEEQDTNSLLPFISKITRAKKTVFVIENPPKEGYFKLQIYARKKPTKKGRLKIPLVANFLILFRHSHQLLTQPAGIRKSFSAAAVNKSQIITTSNTELQESDIIITSVKEESEKSS